MVQVFPKHDDAIWQATTKHSHYNYYYSFFNPLTNILLMFQDNPCNETESNPAGRS